MRAAVKVKEQHFVCSVCGSKVVLRLGGASRGVSGGVLWCCDKPMKRIRKPAASKKKKK